MESDLSGIPVPEVFQEKSSEEIEAALIAKLKELRPEIYANRLQPADPAVSLIKSVASDLSRFRAFANEIGRTQFVAWHKDQQRTRRRFGFGEEYRTRALEIALDLPDETADEERLCRKSKDVLVDSDREGRVILWVLSHSKDGETHQDLTEVIESTLNQEDQKIKTDTIIARSATGKEFNLKAKIWLYPRTPTEIFEGLEARFEKAFRGFRGFQKDINLSWVSSVLHVQGVQDVELTGTENLTIALNECAFLNSVEIKPGGRRT